jgi:gamma-glutamylcyclotransferase (GGCT)/AIG2-like uncharacterized protein YtfP
MLMNHLFTYGSLMYPAVWRRVVRGEYRSATAILIGFARRAVLHVDYPCLIPSSQDSPVNGVLYFDLSEPDFELLDRFEGNMYQRQRVNCHLQDGSEVKTWTYVWSGNLKLVSERAWDQSEFEQAGLKRFMTGYEGFDAAKTQ